MARTWIAARETTFQGKKHVVPKHHQSEDIRHIRRYGVRFYDVLYEALKLSDKNLVFIIKTSEKSS